METEGVKKVLK